MGTPPGGSVWDKGPEGALGGSFQWYGSARLEFISVRVSLRHPFLSDSLEYYFQACQGQIKWLHHWENAESFETDGWLCRLRDLPGVGLCCHMNGNPSVAGFFFLQPTDDGAPHPHPHWSSWQRGPQQLPAIIRLPVRAQLLASLDFPGSFL